MSKVKVTMENHGEFTIELYPEFAPATVANLFTTTATASRHTAIRRTDTGADLRRSEIKSKYH